MSFIAWLVPQTEMCTTNPRANAQQDYIRRSAFADYYQLDVAHRKYEHICENPLYHGDPKRLTGVVHCIDHIRAVLMCHGDTTVRTFEWVKTAHYPVLRPKTTRQCRRWEPIVQWAKSRYPSHENGPILEHPKYGRFTKKNKLRLFV